MVLQDTRMHKDMSECHSPRWHPWRWVTVAGGASQGARAGGGMVGDRRYRCFLNGTAAQAELNF